MLSSAHNSIHKVDPWITIAAMISGPAGKFLSCLSSAKLPSHSKPNAVALANHKEAADSEVGNSEQHFGMRHRYQHTIRNQTDE